MPLLNCSGLMIYIRLADFIVVCHQTFFERPKQVRNVIFQSTSSIALLNISCFPFHVIPRIWSPQLLHLSRRQRLLHFLHVDEFFDREDLSSYGWRDGMVDGVHSFAQPEGFEDARCLSRQTDG